MDELTKYAQSSLYPNSFVHACHKALTFIQWESEKILRLMDSCQDMAISIGSLRASVTAFNAIYGIIITYRTRETDFSIRHRIDELLDDMWRCS